MSDHLQTLDHLVEQAREFGPIRVAVVNAAQDLVLETLREASDLGLVEALLIGEPQRITELAKDNGWNAARFDVLTAATEWEAARVGVRLVGEGRVDALMKGRIHTDTFMRAILGEQAGLRLPGRRVSHAFVTDIPSYPKLLYVTDAAINIVPDLTAKAQIVQNAVELARLLGCSEPKVAALSAVETVNPEIASTIDAACLSLMARRGQIAGALVDGPLAFDNAISVAAAREKGIESPVAGDADIVLVPDLVSGNILAKNLEYMAGATAAGVVLGLSAPVVLSSRADPPSARLAALAVAVLMHQHDAKAPAETDRSETEHAIHCAPQPEAACCPMAA